MTKPLSFFFNVVVLCLGLTLLSTRAVGDVEVNQRVDRTIISGDMLQITVEEQSSLNQTYGVDADGTISFGELGRASVGERTVEEAALSIKRHLESTYFRQATVRVSIAEYVSGEVVLMGALGRNTTPGEGTTEGDGILAAGMVHKFPVEEGQLLSLFDVILSAGGLSPNAKAEEVMIMRWKPGLGLQREIIKVDVTPIFKELRFDQDQFLRPRDIVYVPFLDGEEASKSEILVLVPDGANGYRRWYEGLNVLRLMASIGVDFGSTANNARILRPDGAGEYAVIPVDVGRLFGLADMSQNKELEPGDIFYIPTTSIQVGGEAWIQGEVNQPGPISIPPQGEVTLARTLFVRGTTKFANLKRVEITRKDPTGEKQTIRVNVKEILDKADWDRDVPVKDGDIIKVPTVNIPFIGL